MKRIAASLLIASLLVNGCNNPMASTSKIARAEDTGGRPDHPFNEPKKKCSDNYNEQHILVNSYYQKIVGRAATTKEQMAGAKRFCEIGAAALREEISRLPEVSVKIKASAREILNKEIKETEIGKWRVLLAANESGVVTQDSIRYFFNQEMAPEYQLADCGPTCLVGVIAGGVSIGFAIKGKC